MSPTRFSPQQLYYDGKIQNATSGKVFQSIDPTTSLPLADIHASSPSDIDAAVASAQSAFVSWSRTSALFRARILQKAVTLLRTRNDELAAVETLDTGKPYSETSTVDIATGADVVEYFANLVASGGLNGDTAPGRCVNIYKERGFGSLRRYRSLELSHSDCTLEECALSGCGKLHGL
jgi:betaine-aldehyde dehydrogenase